MEMTGQQYMAMVRAIVNVETAIVGVLIECTRGVDEQTKIVLDAKLIYLRADRLALYSLLGIDEPTEL
jgi:hypothetical protein